MVLVISVLAGGCGTKSETGGQAKKVTLNEVAHSIFYAPMYVAIEEGYFAAEGIDLELVTGYGADKTMTALLTGEADIVLWAVKHLYIPICRALRTML